MITWLIGSILLSAAGGLLYLILRKFIARARTRKQLVYLILGLSLVLPFFIHPPHSHHALVQSDFPLPAAPVNLSFPNTVEEYCHCSDPGKSEVLAYQASRIYDLILNHGNQFIWLFLFIGCLILFREGWKVYRVRRWLRAQEQSPANAGAKLIRSDRFGPAASVSLGGKYILLGPEADGLPEAQRNAVLLHEQSHLNQGNTWEELGFGLLQSLWFLHPAFYFFRAEMRRLSEFIADEAALESGLGRRQYALLLLRLKSSGRQLPFQHFGQSLLRQRILRLQDQKQGPSRTWMWMGLALLFQIGIFLPVEQAVARQIEEIEVYEYLAAQHAATGKNAFCKSCTYETLFTESAE